jgi:hypothetical protein
VNERRFGSIIDCTTRRAVYDEWQESKTISAMASISIVVHKLVISWMLSVPLLRTRPFQILSHCNTEFRRHAHHRRLSSPIILIRFSSHLVRQLVCASEKSASILDSLSPSSLATDNPWRTSSVFWMPGHMHYELEVNSTRANEKSQLINGKEHRCRISKLRCYWRNNRK